MSVATDHPGGVRLVLDGRLATVRLDRPEVRNAQTFATWSSLAMIAEQLPAAVDAVVLCGSGTDFSAGLDLRMMRPQGFGDEGSLPALLAGNDHEIAQRIGVFQRAFSAWRELDAVVVAAVQGRAIGAGFQLALAADLRVATDTASFVMAEIGLGLVPDLGGTVRLLELVGYARALDVGLGRPVPAVEALTLGLVTEIVPADELDQAVVRRVDAILQHRPDAVRALKRLLAGGITRSYDEQLAAERAAQAPLLRGIARPR
ncbi:MAG TPA: enoyl-CoA hydratase/isomerase family protein [Propionibacteriaceae bacterium]